MAFNGSTAKDLFVLCEDCESEWDSPKDTWDIDQATRDTHKFSRYATLEDVAGHPWRQFIVSR